MTIRTREWPVPDVPDAGRMESWLRSPDVVRPDGAVTSWSNPAHPGYPYPEAAGLWLSWACRPGGPRPDALADAVAARLCADCPRVPGGAGRDGIAYLFDSAVALAGLLAYRDAGGRVDVIPAVSGLHAFVAERIRRREASVPAAAGRWSVEFSPHLFKVAKAILAFDRASGTRLADDLLPGLSAAWPGAWPRRIYVHAHCYAVEGLLLMRAAGRGDGLPDPDAEVARLARWQRADGAMPSHAAGDEPAGEARCDATAQAVRLWCRADLDRFAAPIRRALSFLASCQSAPGGIAWAPDGGEAADVNAWTTLFAVQAVCWADAPGSIDEIL